MISVPLISIDEILSQQFHEIIHDDWSDAEYASYPRHYWISDCSSELHVKMERVKTKLTNSSGVESESIWSHRATITIAPPNKKMKKVIENHFHHRTIGTPNPHAFNIALFDTVIINGEPLK